MMLLFTGNYTCGIWGRSKKRTKNNELNLFDSKMAFLQQNFGYPALLIFFLHCWFWIYFAEFCKSSADCCSGLVAGFPAITGKTLFIGAGGDRVTILKLALLQICVYLPAFA